MKPKQPQVLAKAKPNVRRRRFSRPSPRKSSKTAAGAAKKPKVLQSKIGVSPAPGRHPLSPTAGGTAKPAPFPPQWFQALWAVPLKRFRATSSGAPRPVPRAPDGAVGADKGLPFAHARPCPRAGGRIKKEFLAISRFFKKKLGKFLVINFGPAMAEVIYVEPLADKLRLLAYDVQKLSSIAKENREEAGVHFIDAFLKGNAIAERDVVISISDADSIFVKDIVLPVMPEEEILKAAKWQLKDDVLFDLEKASIDWRVLEEFTGEQGEKGTRILFIAANDEVVNYYLSMVQKCQIDPVCVTTGAFNYTHILEKLSEGPAVVAILDVGHTESTFGIYADNKLNFVRRLPISWEKLMQSLTKVLVSDSGVTQFTYEQAEEITRSVGIPEARAVQGDIHASHLMSLMRPLLETLVREIKFSLEYFTLNFEKERPSVLYLTGGSSNLKNLDKYLNGEFHVQVSYLPLPPYVDITALTKKMAGEDSSKIINAMGAALGGLRAINLLPFDIKARKLELVEKVFLRSTSIILGAILLFSFFVMQFQVHNYQGRIMTAQIHLKTMEDVRSLAQRLKEKEELIRKIEGDSVPVEGILKILSATIPDEIVLETLELNPKEHYLTLKGTVLAGGEAAETALSRFLQKLEESLFFTEASFVSSQRTGTDYKFEIKCDIFH
jgi:type IV pilus assembly protein PilM